MLKSLLAAVLLAATPQLLSADETLTLPAHFDFTQPEIPAGWEIVEPEGASVDAKTM
jgi:hypothetical protein